MKATCVLLRSGASDHVRAVSSYLVSDSIEHWPTVPEWKWVWRAWMNLVEIVIVILTAAWIRMEFDWEDGRITLMVGWWGRPQVKVWLVMVVGSSGQRWALADVAAAGICWIRNWVRDQVPGYMGVRMVMGGAGWGGDCVTRPSCFRSCYNLCSCAYPSHPMNWCFVGAKKVWFANPSFQNCTNGFIGSRTG